MATDIPGLSKSQLGDNARALERIREELQILLGLRGDPLDQALTVRDAMRRGLVDSLGRALTGGVTYENYYPIGTGGGGSPPDIDLTPPPTPTGLVVQAGFTQIIVQWDAPTYTQGHGQKQTNVYAVKKAPGDASLPTFEAGVTPRVFVAPGKLTVVSLPSELNTRWHIWITHETVDGVESLAPAGGVNGYNVGGEFPTTGQDIVQLLGILTGQIRESQLYAALAEPIRSIVRRADDAGEDALRAALATHQEGKRASTALLAEAASRGTAITQTRTLVDAGDAQLASQITTLTAKVSTNRTEALAGISDESAARVGGDLAEANQRAILAAQVNDATTGLPATRATLLTDYSTTAGMNAAIASSASSLTTAFGAADAATLASANAFTYARSTIDGAIASSASTLTANYGAAISAAVGIESSARVALDGSVQALYTVRTQVSAGGSTMVGGFGLSATSTFGGGSTIDFGVIANRFYVGAPNDGSAPGIGNVLPFIVQASPTTIGGVSVPAGVYMDTAFIRNGTITNAKIADATIDNAKVASLSASKLTVGDGTVGGDLKSTSFAAGSGVTAGTGWKLTPGGTLYASGAVIYGTVYAYAGVIGGNVIDGTGIQSGTYTAGSLGFRFDSSGLLRAFASAGARVLDMAATGTQPVLKIGTAFEVLANGSATYAGTLNVKSAPSGSRIEITGDKILVYDGANLRVKIGNLA